MTTLLDAALSYAARGWRVFPCEPRGKKPIYGPFGTRQRGQRFNWKHASCDETQVRHWWATWPDANIGLVTGWPDGPGVVLDVDDRTLLEELPEPIRCNRATFTGKDGFHLFFALPDGVTIDNQIGNLPKRRADVRGCGSGYVIAPPSVHPNGKAYRWCKEADAPDVMPAWLLEVIQGEREWEAGDFEPAVMSARASLIAAKHASALMFDADTIDTTPPVALDSTERALLWLAKAEPAIEGAGGQTTLFTVASHVCGFGLALETAQDLLWIHYNPRCSPPWKGAKGEREFRRHVREGYEKGPVPHGDKLGDTVPHVYDSGAPVVRPATAPVAGAPLSPLVAAWPIPEPLEEAGTLPRFPVASLPSWAEEWCDAVAESTQTPPELAGMLALVCASAALAKKAVVRLKSGYCEPLNLWVVVAMPPSSRKSPVFSAATAPLVEYEKTAAAEGAIDIAVSHHEVDVEEARLKRIKAQLVTHADPTEHAELMVQLRDQQAETERAKARVLTSERMLAQDATSEALIGLMAQNGGKIAVLSDEGGVLGIAAGRYSGHVNVDALLQGYSGGDIRVDRRGREPEYVEAAALTLGLTVQPEVLREVFANGAMRGRGLLARPLYVVPGSNVGRRKSALVTRPVPEAIGGGYRAGLMALCKMPQPSTPVEIELTPEAHTVLAAWDTRLELELGTGGRWASISQWAGKLVGGVARLAGVLHVADNGPQGRIDSDTMFRACALGRFCLEHAGHAFDEMGDETAGLEVKARAMLDWLRKQDGAVKRRAILQSRRRHFTGAAEMDLALALLVECGWLRPCAVGGQRAFLVYPGVDAEKAALA